MSRVLDEASWVDVYRRLHPDATDACYVVVESRGRPGPRTSAGVSTISWRRRAFRRAAKSATIWKEPFWITRR